MKNNNKYGWNNADGTLELKIAQCQRKCPSSPFQIIAKQKCKQDCERMIREDAGKSTSPNLKGNLKNQTTGGASKPSDAQPEVTENGQSTQATFSLKSPIMVVGVTVGAAVVLGLIGYAIYKKVKK